MTSRTVRHPDRAGAASTPPYHSRESSLIAAPRPGHDRKQSLILSANPATWPFLEAADQEIPASGDSARKRPFSLSRTRLASRQGLVAHGAPHERLPSSRYR
jgi:hypothetical protein